MSEFKVGDRVRYVGTAVSFTRGRIYEVLGIDKDGDPEVTTDDGRTTHEYASRFELVTNGETNAMNQRRTFKLLKPVPGYDKGALFQEQCEDGTQPYSELLPEGVSSRHNVHYELRDRAMVEDSPQWFTEVFKVTPEYMTQGELDQWEAFKGRKKSTVKQAQLLDYKRDEGRKTVRKSIWTPERRRLQAEKMKASWAAKRVA